MSRMLRLLNRLKAEANRDTLTTTQRLVLEEIEALWQFPVAVNLWGPSGSGKTMVAWALLRSSGGSYYSSGWTLQASKLPSHAHAVVDNLPSDQHFLRRVLAAVQLRDVRCSVLITTEPSTLGLPTVALPLPSPEDVSMVYHNLSLADLYTTSPLREGDLWAVIHSVL